MNAMGLFGEYQQRCSSMLIRFPLSSQSGNLPPTLLSGGIQRGRARDAREMLGGAQE